MQDHEPVLIVGAGPVGLAAAHRLAWHGCPVRIIDSASGPTSLSKALVVWQRTLETLDASLPMERFLHHEDAFRFRGAVLQTREKEIGQVILEQADSPTPTGLLLPQSATEELLVARLAEQGIFVERNTSLKDFETHNDGVRCRIHSDENGDSEENFPWMVGADGAHSKVRHGLELPFPGESVDRRWILGDFSIEQESDPHFLRACLSDDGVIGLFPVGKHRWRLICDTGESRSSDDRGNPTTEELQTLLDTKTSMNWKIRESFWLSEFFINERIVDNYRHGRILLAGDAAHVHSPAGGQGMNTGIQDAINLAWKLALVARQGAKPELLDSYHEERHPVGTHVVEASSRMIRAAMIRNPLLRRLRSFLLPHLMRQKWLPGRMRPFLSETGISYRGQSLAHGRAGNSQLQAGDRLPNLQAAGKPIYQSLRHPGFTLLIAGETSEDWPDQLGEQKLRVVELESGGALAQTLGLSRGQAAVVRPDAYLGTFAQGPDELHSWWGTHLA